MASSGAKLEAGKAPSEPEPGAAAQLGATSPASAAADYAPSPSTARGALSRAGQARVQALLRRLLVQVTGAGAEPEAAPEEQWNRSRIDTLRVLRKTLRELDYQLSWLSQVDLLETVERILREHCELQRPVLQLDWRLVHDCTQLLIESLARLEVDEQTLEQLLPMVVQNLGHERSEVRRASLLLLNLLLNERRQHFKLILNQFIEFGLSNYCNEQAQRGAILSLPLLLNEQLVERQNLQPLIGCLAGLLTESHEQLFYSLYLALERLQMMLGDERFFAAMRQCEPEALRLYRQTASRSNSLVAGAPERARRASNGLPAALAGPPSSRPRQQPQPQQQQQRVTFEESPQQASEVKQDEGASKSAAGSILEHEQAAPAEETTLGELGPEATRAHSSEATSGGPARDARRASAAASSEGARGGEARSPTDSLSPSSIMSGPRGSAASDVSSTCSSDAHLVDPASYMSQAALRGRPLDDYERIHQVDHSNVMSLAINDMGLVSNTPTVELGPGNLALIDSFSDGQAEPDELSGGPPPPPGRSKARHSSTLVRVQHPSGSHSEMKFGIFPRHLVQVALAGGSANAASSSAVGQAAAARHSDRLEAMQELVCIVRESPVNHLAIMMSYFDQFLEQFLAKLIAPAQDYRLELMAIDMLETIVVKTKVSTMHYVRPIVGLLVRTLADARAQQLFRGHTCRVLHKMMAYLAPQHVIDALFEHKHSRSALVREEIINRVTGAVLDYERNEFNLTKLCYHVLPMLADAQSSVRLAALECIATLAHALGPERIGSLLTAAEAVQTGCDLDGLLDAIAARLRRHALPRLAQADASIRHVLRPLLAGLSLADEQQAKSTAQAADLAWLLEAPSSHQQHHELAAGGQAEASRNKQQQHHHHPHRLGVYSPTSVGERRRRSSMGASLGADTERRHHHHHHTLHAHQHHHSDHNQREAAHQPPWPPKQHSKQRARSNETAGRSNEVGAPEERFQQQQRNGCESLGAEAETSETIVATEPSEAELFRHPQRGNTEQSGAPQQQQQQQPDQCCRPVNARPAHQSGARDHKQQQQQLARRASQQRPLGQLGGSGRRSNSQDSLASQDSNKLLFQYYLGKFKQSLAEASMAHQQAPVLPSDSLIYADATQAYALSRHQSRWQQTSFELAGEQKNQGRQCSMGHNAIGPSEHDERPLPSQMQSARHSMIQGDEQRKRANAAEEQPAGSTPSTSGSESPLTVMEASGKSQDERRQSLAAAASGSQTSTKPRPLVRQEASAARAATPPMERHSLASSGAFSRQASEATGCSSGAESADQHQRRRSSRRKSSLARQAQRAAAESSADPQQQQLEQEHEREIRRRASRSQPPPASRGEQRQRQQQQQQQQAAEARRSSSRPPSKQSTRDDESVCSPHPAKTRQQLGAERAGAGSRRAVSVSPSLACNVNIRHILENVAQLEGPFVEPQLALKVALDAIGSPCWSTKVEGVMALIRLINFHQRTILESGHLSELVSRVADETRNLRSTVARSAIFALGELCAKLKRSVEPQLELIVQQLLNKSIENTAFIRDDLRRSLALMVDHLTPWRLANSLIHHGASHKSVHVRRMASQFLAQLVDRMGAAKCLVGAKEISAQVIPAAAKFAQDNSPFTRYYGRLMLAKLMQHGSFDRLLRLNLNPNLYRSTLGIIESVKRRGPGELPSEN